MLHVENFETSNKYDILMIRGHFIDVIVKINISMLQFVLFIARFILKTVKITTLRTALWHTGIQF